MWAKSTLAYTVVPLGDTPAMSHDLRIGGKSLYLSSHVCYAFANQSPYANQLLSTQC